MGNVDEIEKGVSGSRKKVSEWEAMRWDPVGKGESKSWFHVAVMATFVDVSEGDGGGLKEKRRNKERRRLDWKCVEKGWI